MVIEKLEKKVNEAEFINATKTAAEELGFKVEGEEVSKGEEKYRIKKIKENEHKYGQGGHRLNSISLFRINEKSRKILESRDYTSWMTLSDDSEDYPTEKGQFVALYLEDKLARAVFEKLKC